MEMENGDDHYLTALNDGGSQAMADYIEHCRPRLMAFIQRQLGDHLRRFVEPDDVFQEMAIEAVRSVEEMDFSLRDPFSWLCQLVERRIIDLHRRNFGTQKRDAGREVPLDPRGGDSSNGSGGGLINMLAAAMTTPSQAFSREAREYRLLSAVAQLPDDQQKALRWRYTENMPSKEIAEKLGRSDASVRVMLTRALKKLQELLES